MIRSICDARPADAAARPAAPASATLLLRATLLLGCLAAVALAAAFGRPAASLQADPDLAFLLRGMAAIKAALVLAALAAVLWRLGHPVTQKAAQAYGVGVWLMAAACVLVWRLTSIPFAAIVFHLGEFTLLFTAWRDVPALRQARQTAALSARPNRRASMPGEAMGCGS